MYSVPANNYYLLQAWVAPAKNIFPTHKTIFPTRVYAPPGMVRATKSVASTLALLIIFLYVFALVFTMQYVDVVDDPECVDCKL
jgi:hypothetical protein